LTRQILSGREGWGEADFVFCLEKVWDSPDAAFEVLINAKELDMQG
jgi:hypothetical protein